MRGSDGTGLSLSLHRVSGVVTDGLRKLSSDYRLTHTTYSQAVVLEHQGRGGVDHSSTWWKGSGLAARSD